MNIIDATICHILTQLTSRYIALPSKLVLSEEGSLFCFKIDEIKTYLAYHQNNKAKPWATVFREKLSNSHTILLKEFSEIFRARDRGIDYLSICDDSYPYYLRQIKRPPYGMAVLGNKSFLNRPCLAVVGARKADEMALNVAFQLSLRLALEGATVVSGGAMGCDAAAHRGVLSANTNVCPTVAVMASGLDQLYPRFNASLFDQMKEKDALFLSERLLGTKPKPYDFPIRNRIIAGLVQRVILIQASRKSGAINTAYTALDEGRDVMTFLPDEEDIRFAGNRVLVEQGAKYFLNLDDYFKLNWQISDLALDETRDSFTSPKQG